MAIVLWQISVLMNTRVCRDLPYQELYDLELDPFELTNRALDPDPRYRTALLELSRRLGDWSMRTEDAAPVPLPDALANGAISARGDGRSTARL